MNRWELACNWLLGLSALGWGLRPLFATDLDLHSAVVPLTLGALNVLVGLLFICRTSLRVAASPWFLAAALPSFVLGGLAMKLAPQQPWPYYTQVVFALGGAVAFSALACLGRSFALLPGVRQVVVRGPYRVVRHPAYAGECLMLAAVCLAGWSVASTLAGLAAVVFVLIRILAEEATLLSDADYREYAREHRWRLFPGVW